MHVAQRNIRVWREHGRLCARRKAGVHAFVLDALSVLTRLDLDTEQVDGQLHGQPRQHLSNALWTLPPRITPRVEQANAGKSEQNRGAVPADGTRGVYGDAGKMRVLIAPCPVQHTAPPLLPAP